jgi:mannose-1-phosphate guanylyltransferase
MSNVWSLVLAGGNGSRLSSVTRNADGVVVPKQYCRLVDSRSLLENTMTRADRISDPMHTVPVVTSDHARWWLDQLGSRTAESIVVQERNRGTAAGVLLPITHILRRDPGATVVILPSDHHFEDEDTFVAAVHRAVEQVWRRPEHVLIMGIVAEGPDSGYGWIVPAEDFDEGPARVERFVEKPDPREARALLASGALWSPFVLVGKARTFYGLFEETTPALVRAVDKRVANGESRVCYRNGDLPELDFSRDVLERCVDRLRVVPVPACGWSDVGTPERLRACLANLPVPAREWARTAPLPGLRALV